MGQAIECYRCGATIPPERFDLEGWVVLNAWEDGASLLVCAGCQTEAEKAYRSTSEPGDSPT